MSTTFDEITKPSHYNSHPSGLPCGAVTDYLDFNLGCVFKYTFRAGLKESELKDMRKAREYAERAGNGHGGCYLIENYIALEEIYLSEENPFKKNIYKAFIEILAHTVALRNIHPSNIIHYIRPAVDAYIAHLEAQKWEGAE